MLPDAEIETAPKLTSLEPLRPADSLIDAFSIEQEVRDLLADRELLPLPEVLMPERRDNARTALMEALTASGHLSEIEIHGTSIEEIHDQVMTRLLNGYHNDLPLHERWRRFYELCEERKIYRLHQLIEKGDAPETTALAVISDYPVAMDEKAAMEIGYRPDNRKGMVRSTHLVRHEDGSFTRVIHQLSRADSGHETTGRLLETAGCVLRKDIAPDLASLAAPFTYDLKDLTDGVIDLQKRLDHFAGPGVLYGDRQNPKHVPYEELREESREREVQLELYIDRLAEFEARLDALVAAGTINREQREGQYRAEVLQILRAICTLAPEYAEDCFGKKAASFYEQAADFALMGNAAQRDYWLDKAQSAERPVMFCGVMISPEEAKKLGVELDAPGKLIEEGKENWKWKKGVCRVSGCPSRPGRVKVGPCSVCEKCQELFDTKKLK